MYLGSVQVSTLSYHDICPRLTEKQLSYRAYLWWSIDRPKFVALVLLDVSSPVKNVYAINRYPLQKPTYWRRRAMSYTSIHEVQTAPTKNQSDLSGSNNGDRLARYTDIYFWGHLSLPSSSMGRPNEIMGFGNNHRAPCRFRRISTAVCLYSKTNKGTLADSIATSEAKNRVIWFFVSASNVHVALNRK